MRYSGVENSRHGIDYSSQEQFNAVGYSIERIKEIWRSLTADKKKLLDVVIEASSRKILGDTITNAFLDVPVAFGQYDSIIARALR